MANYGLPAPPEKHRWFLAEHSIKYAKLHLQKKTTFGWKIVTYELVDLTGKTHCFEVCIKEEANEILRNISLPKVSYGVVI